MKQYVLESGTSGREWMREAIHPSAAGITAETAFARRRNPCRNRSGPFAAKCSTLNTVVSDSLSAAPFNRYGHARAFFPGRTIHD